MAPLRVLYVLDSHHLGGAEMFLADLLEILDRSRVEPAGLVCPPWGELDPLVERAGRAGVPCLGRVSVEGSWDLGGKRAFARLVRGFQGVLHFNLGSLDSCRHQILSLPPGRPPAVGVLHSLTPLGKRGFFRLWRRRRALGRLAFLAGVSRAVVEKASAYLPAERTGVAPNFLSSRVLEEAGRLASEKPALRKRLGIPRDALVGICMGPLSAFKGQEILLELLPRVARAFPRFLLLLVGGDKRGLAPGFQERARSAGVGDALRWTGWSGEPLAWLAAADLLLLPGGPEGFSRVALEGMAAGMPLVAFRHGGVPELAREGEAGLFAEPGDLEGFARAWTALLGDENARREMGARARKRAEEFVPEKTLESLYGAYEAALTGRPALPGPREPGQP